MMTHDERVSVYADDPLMVLRKTHRKNPEWGGHPDGHCCLGCEAEVPGHVTWPCAVIDDGRCEDRCEDYRCIQSAGHEPETHLMESASGLRVLVWREQP